MSGHIAVAGRIVAQEKNCACGETHEGICEKCGTEALDVIYFEDVESVTEGHYNADTKCMEKWRELV